MARTLSHDHRIRSSKLVDIVVRKDGIERRIEADWVKTLAIIVLGNKKLSMRSKPGLFTWVGDAAAEIEQHSNSSAEVENNIKW